MHKIYGSNTTAPVVPIAWAKLEPFAPATFRRNCPVCKVGMLHVERDRTSYRLKRRDKCSTCRQRFIYTDDTIAGQTFDTGPT